MLPVTDDVASLADQLVRKGALPAGAQNDAVHIAVSAVHGVDYLLTWNFRHLATPRPGHWSEKSASNRATLLWRSAPQAS